MNFRNHAIDWLRAISVLYIIGYWHLFNYIQDFPEYNNSYTLCLTYIILGTFTLTSGYLLANRSINLNWSEVMTFYRRRLIRIYPLYAIALLSFLIAGLANGKTIIKGALLISMFSPPAPPTLWFITMIVVFYLIAPVLISYADRLMEYFLLCGAIMIGFAGMSIFIQPIDLRMLMYFPAFAIGIVIARNQLMRYMITNNRWLMAFMLIPAFWLFTNGNDSTLSGVAKLIPVILIGSVTALVYAERYMNHWQNNTISIISYASFCMYLFHRIVYKYLVMIYFPNELILQIMYLFVFGVSITFIMSYFIQRAYDNSYV